MDGIKKKERKEKKSRAICQLIHKKKSKSLLGVAPGSREKLRFHSDELKFRGGETDRVGDAVRAVSAEAGRVR